MGPSTVSPTDGTYINYNSTSKVLTYKNGTTVLYAPFPTTANLFRPAAALMR